MIYVNIMAEVPWLQFSIIIEHAFNQACYLCSLTDTKLLRYM